MELIANINTYMPIICILLILSLLNIGYHKSKWRFNPTRCRRITDDSIWYLAGDSPYPIHGINFVSLRKAKIGWFIDFNDRWVFTDKSLFSVEHP